MQCYACAALLPDSGIHRSTQCPSCGKDARVCLNCSFYKPGAQYDCKEAISEPVFDKERGNFCDWFRPSQEKRTAKSQDKARSGSKQFNALFGE